MAKAVLFIFFGCLLGLVTGIAVMALVIMSPSLTDQKSLGDLSNLVVALGTIFTLGYTLWQHQTAVEDSKQKTKPRLRLIGAPLETQFQAALDKTIKYVRVEFQFINSGVNAASDLRLRAYACPINDPTSFTKVRDDTIVNPIFGGQGFHWQVIAEFSVSTPDPNSEMFIHLRMDYKNDDTDGEAIQTKYFLKINPSDSAASNMTHRELSPLKPFMKL